MRLIYSIVVIASMLTVLSCGTKEKHAAQAMADSLSTNRDTTVSPGADFFHYANGGWFSRHPIKPSESNTGIWNIIQDTINMQVKHVCERSAADANAVKGSAKQKIGDFYASGMDSTAIDAEGLRALRRIFDKIDAIKDIPSLNLAIADLHKLGIPAAYSMYVGQDDKISSKYAVQMWQGGIGLGERDYYFNTDARNANIRKEYTKHLGLMMGFIAWNKSSPDKSAAVIMKMETDLAKASRKLEALRDPILNYNKMSVGQLSRLTPNIAWRDVLIDAGLETADTVIIGQPEFFTALNKSLASYSIDDWKIYLRWNVINTYAPYLSKNIQTQDFAFFGTVIDGMTEQKPRWKRMVQVTDRSLGDLIGQVYVAEYLPAGSKEKLLEIGKNIQAVFADHIRNLSWMSEPTKKQALSKLDKIVMKVGYPDQWKDLSSLDIDRRSFCGNMQRVNQWRYNYRISKFGKPVDRTEWGMQPQTYNAYYNPSNNEICLPACNVIVPGYEGRLPDDAILYGIIGGSTIGHEITHGFDDQGSQYDENGNLKNWWTAEDRAKFLSKTKMIVKQFNNFVVLDSVHINGDATQGENIADLGGMVMGLEAFRKTNQYKENQKISGLSPVQRYFLGYAYGWMVESTKEQLASRIMTDVHAPPQFRVNGPMSNMPEFYDAFAIKAGDAMYRPDSSRVVIW